MTNYASKETPPRQKLNRLANFINSVAKEYDYDISIPAYSAIERMALFGYQYYLQQLGIEIEYWNDGYAIIHIKGGKIYE